MYTISIFLNGSQMLVGFKIVHQWLKQIQMKLKTIITSFMRTNNN